VSGQELDMTIHNIPRLILATLSSLALASATAAAQPDTTTPTPTPAPAAGPTSEAPPVPDATLSQINGVPVKVGEHHDYYYEFRRWNISTNPVGWMVGLYGLSGSYGLTNHVAVRADANYFDPPDGGDQTGIELGLGAPIYFRRTYDGVFLEPGVIYRRTSSDDLDLSVDTVGPQMLVGWQWMWDGGLNVAVAAGVGRNFTNNDGDEFDDESEVFANGYLRFGYAF
jgi:hypothetical protein